MSTPQLPLPPHFDADRVDKVWRIPYQERQREAQEWAEKQAIRPGIGGYVSDVSVARRCPKYILYPGLRTFRWWKIWEWCRRR